MSEPQITISAGPMMVKNLLITEVCEICKRAKACSFTFGGPPEELNQVAPEMCCCRWLYPSATIVHDLQNTFYLRYESEKIMHEAAAPPRIEALLSDETVLAHIREFVNGRVKYAMSKYEDADEVAHLLPLYLLLQQLDQAEHHFAEIHKRDVEWRQAVAERDQQILKLQERYTAAEEALVEVHRQHAQAIQEQQAQALAGQDRVLEEHLQMIEEVRQHPENFTVIAGGGIRHGKKRLGLEPPMTLDEYESSAKEP